MSRHLVWIIPVLVQWSIWIMLQGFCQWYLQSIYSIAATIIWWKDPWSLSWIYARMGFLNGSAIKGQQIATGNFTLLPRGSADHHPSWESLPAFYCEYTSYILHQPPLEKNWTQLSHIATSIASHPEPNSDILLPYPLLPQPTSTVQPCTRHQPHAMALGV